MKHAVTVIGLLLAGCSGTPALGGSAAVITNPSAESHAELQRIVSLALHRPSVLLADDALTKDSVLLLERPPMRDANGMLIQGRELKKPERFLLSKEGRECVLTYEHTQQRWLLKQAHCKALK